MFEDLFGGPRLDNVQLPGYQDNRNRLTQGLDRGSAYVGANPYRQGWDALISQLQGQGPSLAQAQYQRATQDGNAALMGMARSSNRPGGFRAALNQQARANQGLAAGSSEAMLQEQAQNRQQLGGALAGAGQAQWQRDQANQQAWQGLMQQRMGLDQDQFQALLQREQLRASTPTRLQQMIGVGGQALQFAGMAGIGGGGQQGGNSMANRYRYSY